MKCVSPLETSEKEMARQAKRKRIDGSFSKGSTTPA
jgi:hypothetical protein